MFQKIIFAITIVLCLGLISCGEPNKPIDNEPIVINVDNDDPIIINKPVITVNGELIVLEYHPYFGSDGNYGGINIYKVVVASDLIVVTKVKEIDNSKNPHTAYLTITETLHGSTIENEIRFNTNSFSQNEEYILFLCKKGDSHGLTTRVVDGNWSAMSSSIIGINPPWIEEFCKDDIKSILSAYNNNNEIFAKFGASKQALFQLYPQLNSWFVKLEV